MIRLIYSRPEDPAGYPLGGSREDQPLDRLLSRLSLVNRLDGETFHRLRYELVDRYRTNEHEQERIAVAVKQAYLRVDDPYSRERLDEMLRMMLVTHDPMI